MASSPAPGTFHSDGGVPGRLFSRQMTEVGGQVAARSREPRSRLPRAGPAEGAGFRPGAVRVPDGSGEPPGEGAGPAGEPSGVLSGEPPGEASGEAAGELGEALQDGLGEMFGDAFGEALGETWASPGGGAHAAMSRTAAAVKTAQKTRVAGVLRLTSAAPFRSPGTMHL